MTLDCESLCPNLFSLTCMAGNITMPAREWIGRGSIRASGSSNCLHWWMASWLGRRVLGIVPQTMSCPGMLC